jgi:phasin family protein
MSAVRNRAGDLERFGTVVGPAAKPATEEQMTQAAESYLETFRKFGSDLGIPKFDLDKVIESHRKNVEALVQSASAASAGAQSMAQKQRETFEAALREASTLAKTVKPMGDPAANLTAQNEFAKKVFEIAMQGAKETAETGRQSTTDAFKIVQDRMKESFEEFRNSFRRNA